MSLPLYPAAFPTATNTKWSIRRVVAGSSSNIRTQNTRSNSIATSPITKRDVTTKASSNQHVTRVASAAAVAVTSEKVPPTIEASNDQLEFMRIRKGGFWLRKWHKNDVLYLILVLGRHALAVSAPFVFNTGAVWVAVVLLLMSGIGVTLGFHRLLTHRSFKVPKWLEYCFAYCGCHACLNDPIYWVSIHKNHHKYADQERDPHSPREGFWFSHFGWFHYNEYLALKCGEPEIGEYSNVPELKEQWFYRFLQDTYFLHLMGLGVLLYLIGGYPYLAWGMGMRTVIVNHSNFLVGSVTHLWGGRPYNTRDTSTNNGFIAMLSLGEGWHNNHHAFPKSARHGLEWWQLDITWEVIKFLEAVGLATDVHLPSEADKKRMKMSPANAT